MDHSDNKIGLPHEVQQKINSLNTESNKNLITEQTNKEEEKLEVLYVLISIMVYCHILSFMFFFCILLKIKKAY